jgi:molybdopterin-guanine dinucleotide biosynthesis adapter protein
MRDFRIPVLGICAQSSGMGKTTLLTALLPALDMHGLRVSIIKQTHAEFDVDRPGKDSYRLREAGAAQVLLSSENRWVLMTEQEADAADIRLLDMIGHLDPALADIVLVEGFRHAPIPKIEVYRPSLGKALLADSDQHVIAVATDGEVESELPILDLNDSDAIGNFVLQWLDFEGKQKALWQYHLGAGKSHVSAPDTCPI